MIPKKIFFLTNIAFAATATEVNINDFINEITSQQYKTFTAINNINKLDLQNSENSENNDWIQFHSENNMDLYYQKDPNENDDRIIEPIALFYEIDQVSAFEVANVFYGVEHKKDIDRSILKFDFLDVDRDNLEIEGRTMVVNQFHDTIWPASHREAYYLSNMEKIETNADDDECILDTWLVNNFSLKNVQLFSKFESQSVRVDLTISLLAQTIDETCNNNYHNHNYYNSQISRENIKTKIIYISRVDPGGWVPAGILRNIYKDEYPYFLETLTDIVIDAVNGYEEPNMNFEDWDVMMDKKNEESQEIESEDDDSWWFG